MKQMVELDPDIKAFRDAESDAHRAAILLCAPVGTLLRWRDVFERYARVVGFMEGTNYLAALSVATRRRRQRGTFGSMELDGATTRLLGLIEAGKAR